MNELITDLKTILISIVRASDDKKEQYSLLFRAMEKLNAIEESVSGYEYCVNDVASTEAVLNGHYLDSYFDLFDAARIIRMKNQGYTAGEIARETGMKECDVVKVYYNGL